MRRRWKLALGALAASIAILALNAFVTSADTESAKVTVAGGRILDLPGGAIQVVEHGPRAGTPVVLIHGFGCSIAWWDRTILHLERGHRVVALDLLGHGGSEKPDDGYSMEEQAALVAAAMERLGVRGATVVGHSLGAVVATALAEWEPALVERVVVLDQAPDSNGYGARLPLHVWLTFQPVIGEALWRLAPDAAIEGGLAVGFAPGYDVPDGFVDDFRRLTYTAFDESAEAESDYSAEAPLDVRLRRTGTPLLAIFGSEEQIFDPRQSLTAYGRLPNARTELVPSAGHSPNVERPALTAALIDRFMRESAPRGVKPGRRPDPGTKKGRPEGRP